jgi:hypothetical protein
MNIISEEEITQQWVIDSVDTQSNFVDGTEYQDCIKKVYYTVVSTFEDFSYQESGFVILDAINPETFVPFDQMSSSTVIEWVKDALGDLKVRGILVNGARELTQMMYPSMVNKQLPS